MNKLYTAVGQYKLSDDGAGRAIPTVCRQDQDYCLDIHEMILWSTLLWSIESLEDLELIYSRKEQEAGLHDSFDFKTCLRRLEQRGLVVFGQGIDGEGSLLNLLSSLYVVPLRVSLLAKTATAFKLLLKGFPLTSIIKIFVGTPLCQTEKKLLGLSRQTSLTVAELLMRYEHSVGLDYLQAPRGYRRSTLNAIANLYLKKEIILQ